MIIYVCGIICVCIDGICHAQDDDIVHSYTIGKAMSAIDFPYPVSRALYQSSQHIIRDVYEVAAVPIHLLL